MKLTDAGKTAIEELSRKYEFGPDAVASMLASVVAGNGAMAQFQHPEFGGPGQWMRGGMIMLGDMFNHSLKGRVDGLCTDLSSLIFSQPDLLRKESLVIPAQSSTWWGADLGQPSSTGAQNSVRYAWFPGTRRLAIEVHGRVIVYDTGDHQIGGFGQQQSHGSSLTFTSQHGLVDVSKLPVIAAGEPKEKPPAAKPAAHPPRASERPEPPRPPEPETGTETAAPQPPRAPEPRPPVAAPPSSGELDVFATLEKLAALHGKGILTDEEFAAKKADLLGRL